MEKRKLGNIEVTEIGGEGRRKNVGVGHAGAELLWPGGHADVAHHDALDAGLKHGPVDLAEGLFPFLDGEVTKLLFYVILFQEAILFQKFYNTIY